jgi:hypothetical protein
MDLEVILKNDIKLTKCLNYKRKKHIKTGEYEIEQYFINKLAPNTKEQEKFNADYLQC